MALSSYSPTPVRRLCRTLSSERFSTPWSSAIPQETYYTVLNRCRCCSLAHFWSSSFMLFCYLRLPGPFCLTVLEAVSIGSGTMQDGLRRDESRTEGDKKPESIQWLFEPKSYFPHFLSIHVRSNSSPSTNLMVIPSQSRHTLCHCNENVSAKWPYYMRDSSEETPKTPVSEWKHRELRPCPIHQSFSGYPYSTEVILPQSLSFFAKGIT